MDPCEHGGRVQIEAEEAEFAKRDKAKEEPAKEPVSDGEHDAPPGQG